MNISIVENLVPASLLEEQIQQNKKLLKQITLMQQQLDVLLRSIYGQKSEKRKSNKIDKEQNDDNIIDAEEIGVTSEKELASIKSNQAKRKPLPDNLHREKIKHTIDATNLTCSNCKKPQHIIGKEVTEQLELIPVKMFVKQHVRYKYSCRFGCEIKIAPMPEQPIPKGIPGPNLLADILISKYQDALPLYRQMLRFKRYDIDIADSTICDWVTQCANLLAPVVRRLKQDILLQSKLNTDDTPIPVLNKGKTKTARLWTYVADGSSGAKATVYDFSMTRSQKAPQAFLQNFKGYLQADAYPGYDKLYAAGNIIEVGCLAHVRRKFYDVSIAVKTEYDTLADAALDIIGNIYKHEKIARALSHEQRYYYRKRHSKPCYHSFYRWLIKNEKITITKTPIHKAIKYALNHWRALQNVLADGRLDVDNNKAERSIRPLVIGRKNYLFAGSPEGGKRAAIIYSIIESCKQNGINAVHYLSDVLSRAGTHKINQIHELLPYNWRPLQQA